jgi:serine protease Do
VRFTALVRGACACLIFTFLHAHAAGSLSGHLQAEVRNATFEIVMKKPQADSLAYERPLPLDELPFSERNDDYRSMGSAFAIGDNRFVTAAHVLSRGFRTQYGEPAVRQPDGSVHPITAIFKYSSLRDFVVFSCATCARPAALEVTREPALDTEVFAVGNALGEGIVIRDGLLTSMTPETRYGKWKWLRFSAAASPGNSGGPLLDARGRVIGVVLRKSESENLNFALPIAELLDAPADVAELEGELRYWLPFFQESATGRREEDVPLPKTFAEFAQASNAFWDRFYDELNAEIRQKHADALFPRGEGSTQLLYLSPANDWLGVIVQQEDKSWTVHRGSDVGTAQLPDNGYASASYFNSFLLVKIRRPDSADPGPFYAESARYMDTLLKLIPWKRSVGISEIRITSMGPAKEDGTFEDSYGRKWQRRTWNAEYQDSVVTSYALPTPEGYVGMMKWSSTAGQHDVENDLRTMTDFVHVAYAGTLKQWQDYLALGNLLPRALTEARVSFEYGGDFEFRSPRFSFTYDDALQKILPESGLQLGTNYVPTDKGFSWEVTNLVATEDATGDAGIVVGRRTPPAPTLPQEFGIEWRKMVAREQDWSDDVQYEDGISTIKAMYPYPDRSRAASDPPVVYALAYMRSGESKERQMKAALKRVSRGLRVLE